jgi:hypothetical protein
MPGCLGAVMRAPDESQRHDPAATATSDQDVPLRVVGQTLPRVSGVMCGDWTAEPFMVMPPLVDQLTPMQLGAYLWLARQQSLRLPVTTQTLAQHLGHADGARRLVHELLSHGLLQAESEQTERLAKLEEFEEIAARQQARKAARAGHKQTPTPKPALRPEIHEPGEDGQWRGPWPLAADTTYPPPDQNVVYVLRAANDLAVYVGSTNNFRARMKAHQAGGKSWTTWTAHPCESREEAYEVENEFLHEYMPHLNVAGPRPGGAA